MKKDNEIEKIKLPKFAADYLINLLHADDEDLISSSDDFLTLLHKLDREGILAVPNDWMPSSEQNQLKQYLLADSNNRLKVANAIFRGYEVVEDDRKN